MYKPPATTSRSCNGIPGTSSFTLEPTARVFGPSPDRTLPAAQVKLRYGTLTVLLDEAAASKL